ncbi:MAG: stage V sporulation protein T [Clostridia bacterium]|nr:stage V sporulation protein T [Clostridia bacterium]
MKATGIVRRIDELGRVVIPKEIRRTLRIREGDPLEIFVDREGGVILRKYSPIGELGDYAEEFAAALHRSLGCVCAVCDRDVFIAAAGVPKKELVGRPVHEQLDNVMRERIRAIASAASGEAVIPVAAGEDEPAYTAELIVPVVSSGDPIGAVILLSKERGAAFGEAHLKACETAAGFMGRQLEDR